MPLEFFKIEVVYQTIVDRNRYVKITAGK